MDEQLLRWSSFLLLVTSSWKLADGQPNTVQLELGDLRPSNNTVVLITDIGDGLVTDGGDPLVCATQLSTCCGSIGQRFGDWFYPNGTQIPNRGTGNSFYRTRRDSVPGGVLGAALLHHRFDVMDPTGIYSCVIRSPDGTDQTLYVGLYTSTINAAEPAEPIVFQRLTSYSAAQSVTFSLTCTSNGGPVNTMQWEKDGVAVPGSSIYPDLTDTETATYSNTLHVTGRETGIYTCTITDGATLSLSKRLTVKATNPPRAVSANQNALSGLISVSWSPPAVGGAEFTGYRIYYTIRGALTIVGVTSTERQYVQLNLGGALPDDMMLNIRAESVQLPSELVTVIINTDILATTAEELAMTMATATSTTPEEPEVPTIEMPMTTTDKLPLTTASTVPIFDTISTSATKDQLSTTDVPLPNQTPKSVVQLISDAPNPILSGSSLTLSCVLELSHAVDNVTMMINGPNNKKLFPSATIPVRKYLAGLRYMSSITLETLESVDSGDHICTVNINVIEVEVSAKASILIVDGMFQLRLKSVDICQQWYNQNFNETKQYGIYIKEALVEAIERRCKCYFPAANLLEESFSCEDSPNSMTYRNMLLNTRYFNGTQIIGFIQEWVSTSPRIKTGRGHVRVDSSCPVAVSSLDEPECGQRESCLVYADDSFSFVKCAEQFGNQNLATCLEGSIIRNG